MHASVSGDKEMFVSRFVESAFRKAISLAFVSLLVTASFAQNQPHRAPRQACRR